MTEDEKLGRIVACFWDPYGKGHRTGWLPLPPDGRDGYEVVSAADRRLALWLTPDAIRDHYDGDDEKEWVRRMSDGDLREVGEAALQADELYEAFHGALSDALAGWRIRRVADEADAKQLRRTGDFEPLRPREDEAP